MLYEAVRHVNMGGGPKILFVFGPIERQECETWVLKETIKISSWER